MQNAARNGRERGIDRDRPPGRSHYRGKMVLGSLVVLALAGEPALPPSSAPVASPSADRVRRVVPLRRRSIGLGVTAGAFGVAWIGLKMVGTANDPALARDIQSGKEDAGVCIESCYVGTLFNPIGAPVLVGAAGFLGGSMHAHGRRLAHEQRGLGRSRRNGVILAAVGGGVLGAGLVGLGLGIGGQWIARTPTAAIASREVGWWSGAALGVTGAALLGLGHGILRGHRERREGLEIAVAPMLGSRIAGLTLSGRF